MAQPHTQPASASGLAPAQHEALATVLSQCPDPWLVQIQSAANDWPGERAVSLIEAITRERCLRTHLEALFAPVAPLFRSRNDSLEALTFPAGLLPRLGRLAADREAELLRIHDLASENNFRTVSDRMCVAAAGIVREMPDRVWPQGLWPEAQAARENLPLLADCLELCSLVRPGLVHLEAWIGRCTADDQTSLKLLLRDADERVSDGGVRVFDILVAHVADASQLPQLFANALGSHVSEALAKGSDAGLHIERLFAELERQVAWICQYKPAAGDDLAPFLKTVFDTNQLLLQVDMCLPQDPRGTWMASLRQLRVRLGNWSGKQFERTEKLVSEALPLERVQLSGRMTREAPRLDADPASAAAQDALIAAEMLGAAHGWANTLGSESQRKQAETQILERITRWTDEALEALAHQEAEEPNRVLDLIALAASLLDRLKAAELARTVRRRAGAAERELHTWAPASMGVSPDAA